MVFEKWNDNLKFMYIYSAIKSWCNSRMFQRLSFSEFYIQLPPIYVKEIEKFKKEYEHILIFVS